MAKIGYGYGSECHLLRWMGRHRKKLEDNILNLIGERESHIEFLDFHFKPGKLWPDTELKGLDFIPTSHAAHEAWAEYWPQRGNAPNWDTVGKIIGVSGEEWLLVEAKSHIEELLSSCGAKERGGLPKIRKAFERTIQQLDIKADAQYWLEPYYQYANRLAVLSFLHDQRIKARLLNIYFVGDFHHKGWTSPQTIDEWLPHLSQMKSRLGLCSGHNLKLFVSTLFLDVAPTEEIQHGIIFGY